MGKVPWGGYVLRMELLGTGASMEFDELDAAVLEPKSQANPQMY